MVSLLRKIFILIIVGFSVIYGQDTTHISLNLIKVKKPFGIVLQRPAEMPKIGIALSGGGARGLAQLGFLEALNKLHIPIDLIVGTSMGSILGGLYSAGYRLEDLDKILSSTNWDNFFSGNNINRNELFVDQKITEDKAIFSLRLNGLKPILPTSLNTGQRISYFLNALVLNSPLHVRSSFDSLLFPFRAVSTDLITGKKIVLKSGSLTEAMRASSSVSFLLPPVKIGSHLLVDGGLVANIPVKTAKKLGCNYVIAFDATSLLRTKKELKYPWQIADQLVSIPTEKIKKEELKEANIVIRPDLKKRQNTDFSHIERLIKEGYKATEPYLDSIKINIHKLFMKNLSRNNRYFTNITDDSSHSKIERELINKIKKYKKISTAEIKYQLYKLYNSGNYKSISADVIKYPDKSILKIYAVKNPIVKKIKIAGNKLISLRKIEKITDTLVQRPYNPKRFLNVLLRILQKYREKGLALAAINKAHFNKSTGVININISEGLISKIELSGNTKTEDTVIKRELPFSVNTYARINQIKKALSNLRTTDLFKNIEIKIKKTAEKKNIIDILIKERSSQILRFGLRIDNENYTQASVDIRDENLFGTGSELGLIISLGARKRSIILEQKANRIFDTYFTYKIRLYNLFNDVNVYKNDKSNSIKHFSRSKTGEYRQIFTGFTFALGAQAKKFGDVYGEFKYERNEIKNKYDYTGSIYKMDISSLRFGMRIDSQNKYPYPTNGFFLNTYYETALSTLGSNVGFTKFFINYRNYLTISQHNTLISSFKLGFADKTLPLSQQFSLGGQNSFFGLREYEYRGRQIFQTSLAYRVLLPFKIFFPTYASIRYDLGSIWAEKEDIRFKDLRHGIGFTFSLKTPIGPANFSVGRSFIFRNTFSKNTLSLGPVFFYFTIGYQY